MTDQEFFNLRTKKVIPDGVQTLSKMPTKHVSGVYPIFAETAKGCKVYCRDVKDDRESENIVMKKYIDYPCALGAILLGYNDEDVNKAVIEQMRWGTLFSIPHKSETYLAEEISQLIPSIEMMRFVKTGSEANTAAVRVARAFTRKEGIAACGYGGWHDWCAVATPKRRGIPRGFHDYIAKFEYNNIESLKEVFALSKECRKEVGVVIMEPYIYDKPNENFFKELFELTHYSGAVVIFDEVVTGFRTRQYSAQNMFGVKPDLTTFGKALGNGYPIAGFGGRRDIMKVLEDDCFVSSTFGGELVGISAALAVIKKLKSQPIIEHIWNVGLEFKRKFNELVAKKELSAHIECIGYPCRTFFKFPNAKLKGLFWQECLKRGVFFGYAQFINSSHQFEDIEKTMIACDAALDIVKANFDEPEKALEGLPPQETFRLIAARKP